jgi:predicted RNase H-like HicB family nuclease
MDDGYDAWAGGIRTIMGPALLRDDAPRETSRGGFHSWLPKLTVHALIGRRNGQWYALATEYSVVGMGETEQDARDNLSGLLEAYLRTFYEQGRAFHEARRPVGTLTRLRLFLPLKPRKRQLLFAAH